jgi:hypothetical protein
MRARARNMAPRLCVRTMFGRSTFSLAPPLRSTTSVAAEAAWLACFWLLRASPTSPLRALVGYGPRGDLPVPPQEASVHARVYDDAGSAGLSRKRRLLSCLLLVLRTSAPRICLTPLNTWPARSPVNASRRSSQIAAHDSGPASVARYALHRDGHPPSTFCGSNRHTRTIPLADGGCLAASSVWRAVRAIANCGWSRYAGPYRLSRGTAPHEREYPRRKDSF